MKHLQTLTVSAMLLGGTALSAQAQELKFIMCGGEVRPADQVVIDKFQADNPGVTVAMEAVPWGTCQDKSLTLAAAGDPVAGKKSFIQCQMCHTAETGGANRIGPNLAGVVGSKAASKPGFTYSAALSKTGWTWNAKTLDTFIKKPAAAVPGTKMVYAGLADDTARANVIAYLATLKAK